MVSFTSNWRSISLFFLLYKNESRGYYIITKVDGDDGVGVDCYGVGVDGVDVDYVGVDGVDVDCDGVGVDDVDVYCDGVGVDGDDVDVDGVDVDGVGIDDVDLYILFGGCTFTKVVFVLLTS